MRITYEQLSQFITTDDQVLVKISRKEQEVGLGTSVPVFTMKNSTDKEIKHGHIVCSDKDHPDWVGKSCIIPTDGTIILDSFIDIDDASEYEYRLIKIMNIFLIQK